VLEAHHWLFLPVVEGPPQLPLILVKRTQSAPVCDHQYVPVCRGAWVFDVTNLDPSRHTAVLVRTTYGFSARASNSARSDGIAGCTHIFQQPCRVERVQPLRTAESLI